MFFIFRIIMHLFRYFLYLLAVVFHTSPTVWGFIAGYYGDFIALKKKKNSCSSPWWLRWESVCLECGRPGFHPQVGKIPWRRKWQPTPVLLPGKSHGQRSLVGYSPWGRKESDRTDRLHFNFQC